MATKTLTVELPEDIYERFIENVTMEGGPWRSKRKKETFNQALESAVYAAMVLFLQNITEGPEEMPEFREYAHAKYPEMNEDIITMIEGLIKRQKQIAPALKPRTIHRLSL